MTEDYLGVEKYKIIIPFVIFPLQHVDKLIVALSFSYYILCSVHELFVFWLVYYTSKYTFTQSCTKCFIHLVWAMELDEFEQTILVGNLSCPTFLIEGIL